MVYRLDHSTYQLAYAESRIEQPILWENHCHAQFEMILVEEGDITVTVEGKRYRLKKSQGVVIPPLLYHSVTANEEGIYRRITALFGIDAIPSVLQDEFTNREREVAVDCTHIDKLKDICQRDIPPFYAPLLQGLMIEIFYDALRMPQTPANLETDEFLQRTFQYIDLHLHEKILLDDLAQYTLRSKSSFCHLFEEKMSISPKQYILQKKLALASKLISEGTAPTVAAMKIGYDNYSNFYRLYRKRFESNPTHKD